MDSEMGGVRDLRVMRVHMDRCPLFTKASKRGRNQELSKLDRKPSICIFHHLLKATEYPYLPVGVDVKRLGLASRFSLNPFAFVSECQMLLEQSRENICNQGRT
ncbi:hypothetical protein CEP52_004923 [Fusarium oligoseptatum]|uniref:Uncharacterized protein n=2 Tax=Fusarium solani species complex TaxID=232080 RepID=A0A428U0Z6_9HYPO|nr:hypothetical protein CEP51_003709 [Fusarium floridanum]RSM07963.1 hypothetical protein CEP52_004923 [Fusarium oligoseptatum]